MRRTGIEPAQHARCQEVPSLSRLPLSPPPPRRTRNRAHARSLANWLDFCAPMRVCYPGDRLGVYGTPLDQSNCRRQSLSIESHHVRQARQTSAQSQAREAQNRPKARAVQDRGYVVGGSGEEVTPEEEARERVAEISQPTVLLCWADARFASVVSR